MDVAERPSPSIFSSRFDVIDRDNNASKSSNQSSSKNFKDSSQLDMGRKLLTAAKLGDADEIKRLVASGAPFTADWLGTSPLHWTAYYNYIDITELLLRSGISHDARNKVDRTPLHVASQMGHVEIVKLLLAFGADPNARDMLRMSPLHWAADGGSKEVARILLDHGAYTNSTSKFGKTPSDCAEDTGHFEIIKMIEEMKALAPDERVARVHNTRKESAIFGKKLRLNEDNDRGTSGDILQMVAKRRKIAFFPLKENENSESDSLLQVVQRFDNGGEKSTIRPSNSLIKNNTTKTLELLKDHGITMLEPDNGTVVSSAVENGQSVKLTEAGKLALNTLKPKATIEIPKVSGGLVQQTIKLPNGKKIIQIKADELINMTKKKKIMIQPTRNVSNLNLYENNAKDTIKEELAAKLKSKMIETEKQVSQLRRMLQQKETELAEVKTKYDELMSKPNNANK